MNQERALTVHHSYPIILGVMRWLPPLALRDGFRDRARVRVRVRVRVSYPTHSTAVAPIIHI